MTERETRPISPELAQQNADLETLRRVVETMRLDVQDMQDFRRRVERTMHVQSHAESVAREIELRERYGRLGLPR